jgi:hypothetical protein
MLDNAMLLQEDFNFLESWQARLCAKSSRCKCPHRVGELANALQLPVVNNAIDNASSESIAGTRNVDWLNRKSWNADNLLRGKECTSLAALADRPNPHAPQRHVCLYARNRLINRFFPCELTEFVLIADQDIML